MAILQQQRQHQQGGGAAAGGGSSKLSPSHLGGGLSKQPMVDPLPHPGMGSALSDLHAKTQGMYSGESKQQQQVCGRIHDACVTINQTGSNLFVVGRGNVG